jgi:hypothetical protein
MNNDNLQDNDMQNLELDFNRAFVKGNLKSGMKAIGASSSDLWMIDPASVKIIEGYNVRVHDDVWEERVQALMQSMMDEGYKKDCPISVIVVREGDENVIYLKRGHTRLEAVQRAIKLGAPITAISAVATQTDMSEEDMIADLVLSNNGEKLSPYETAIVCKRLARFVGDSSKIARKLGLSKPYVDDLLLMIDGPFVIREYVRNRVITATFAIEMLKKHGDKAVEEIEASIARARASNSTKVSGKHAAGAVLTKAVKKAAPQMRLAINEVKADPAYAQLSQETRARIDAVFQSLKDAESAEASLATTPDLVTPSTKQAA